MVPAAADQPAQVTTRRATPLSWLLLAFCTVAVASLLAAPTAARAEALGVQSPGGIGVRLLDAPAATAEEPRAGLYIIDHLAPGAVIERRIEVSNTTAAPAAIRMYAAGASIHGGAFVGDAGDSPNELSTWNAVRPGTLDLDAGGRASVTVTIAVPGDAAPGERYAVVWAEVRSDAAPDGGVAQVNRVGIRQYVSVGPGGAPAADFTVDSLTARRSADGSPLVLATVHNTGGRALDMAGELELLDGPGGLRAGPFPASLGSTLAIGDSAQVTIPLDQQVPDGPWGAAITLRSGLLERSAQATLTFPQAGSAAPVPVTPADGRWPFLVLAGLLLALLCVALLWAIARPRHDTSPDRNPAAEGQLVATTGPPPGARLRVAAD